jgi:DNA-binding transcriptional regulator of glucitol operon
VLRLVFSPRWIMWHLLTLGAMVTCGLLSAWQWGRAGSETGSLLNVGYGLQWPLFAAFFGVMWFRMLRLELRRLRGEQPEEAPSPPVPEPQRSGPSPFTARPADVQPITDETDPELAAYNRMLAALAQQDRAQQDRAQQDRAHENRTR